MANSTQIQYTIQGGNLPVGVTMNPTTGVLVGNLSPENLNMGPIWNNSDGTVLTAVNVGDTVNNTTISVTPRSGTTIAGIGVTTANDPLPWGLSMNPRTGAITGTVAPLKSLQALQLTNANPPVWATNFGLLGSYSESATINLSLNATPQGSKTIKSYVLVQGKVSGLPWGLSLNPRTGAITGTTQEIKAPGFDLGLSPSVLTPPLWTTAPGAIAVQNEFDVLSTSANPSTALTLAASAQSGKSMGSYVVISGSLPWGLAINPKTGVIAGTCAEVKLSTDPIIYDHTKDPGLGTSVTVQGSALSLSGDGQSLGTYAKGTAITIQFNLTPYSGRTARCHISNGSLPLGLKLSGAGAITGTILSTKYSQSGTYNFTLRVVDNIQAYSLRAFSITVQ